MISGLAEQGRQRAGAARIDAVSIWQNVMAHFEQLERHLLDEILVFANLIQIPAVILTGGVAWLVCRPLRRRVRGWVERVPEHHHLDWVVSHRSWGLCAKIALSQSSRRVFGQVGAFSVKRAILHENPLLESRIMRSAASGGVSKARTSKIAPA
jgi:hypothetical protein